MKKILFFTVVVLLPFLTQAQIGINTANPKTTLQVNAINDKGAVTGTDGILVPRVNALAVNGTEDGQLVYLIADASTFKKGFHFWNATTTAWEPIAGPNITASNTNTSGGSALEKDDDESLFTPFGAYNNNGLYNIKIGFEAGKQSNTQSFNTILGTKTAQDATIGERNFIQGYLVGKGADMSNKSTIASDNIIMGSSAALASNVGSDNIALGQNVLNAQTIGNNNIAIGKGVKLATTGANANDQLNIQNAIYGVNNNGTGATPSATGRIGIGQAAPEERLDVNGVVKADGYRVKFQNNGTLDAKTGFYNATGSTSITLPSASAVSSGRLMYIRNSGSSQISINTTGFETIDSGPTYALETLTTVTVISNGSGWFVISEFKSKPIVNQGYF